MFKVEKQKDGRFTFLSHHGHFLSAQPNGTFQVNRREAKEWEMFTVEEAQFERGSFPALADTVWYWAHNGSKHNGTVTFLKSGQVSWSGGGAQGRWKLENGGLTTSFNNVDHTLECDKEGKWAILRTPVRNPPSSMWYSYGT